jgi:SOS-response transcriptional repressor LexA
MHHMHMDIKRAVGAALRRRRNAAHLSQPEVAELSGGAIDQGRLSKVERGKEGMSPEVLDAVARALGTRAGIILMEADAIMDGSAGESFEATAHQLTQAMGVRHVPMISWVEAGNFAEAVDAYARGTGQDMIQTSAKVGRLAYALRVHGPSMTNPKDDRKTFPDGSIIIVDPHRDYQNGSLIIARLEDEKEATFKQYFEDGGKKLLVPLNPQFSSIPIDRPMMFCGSVVALAERPLDA